MDTVKGEDTWGHTWGGPTGEVCPLPEKSARRLAGRAKGTLAVQVLFSAS